MADTIMLKQLIEGHTHLLPFHYTGNRGVTGRLVSIWGILRGRSVLWFGNKGWPVIPVKEVRDLAEEKARLTTVLREERTQHKADIRRYQAAIAALNAKLPEAEQLQKTHSGVVYVVSGGGGSGGPFTNVTELPTGYEWPKPDPLKDLEERVVTLEKKVSK